jgi:hypothetical protein
MHLHVEMACAEVLFDHVDTVAHSCGLEMPFAALEFVVAEELLL